MKALCAALGVNPAGTSFQIQTLCPQSHCDTLEIGPYMIVFKLYFHPEGEVFFDLPLLRFRIDSIL